jgi:ABC-2 type transport system permease protein
VTDLWTVVRKEWRDAAAQDGSRLSGVLGYGLALLVLGVVFPFFQGREWLTSNTTGLLFLPVFFVAPLVADSFAGERERRTLETLLASRLSDRAIVLGKIAAAVAVGWFFALAIRALGLLTVNLRDGNSGWLSPSDDWWLSTLLSLLACVSVGGVGAVVSMRSPSVKAATQRTTWVALFLVLVPFAAISGAAIVTATYLDSFPSRLAFWLVTALAAGALVAIPVVLAVRRFRRDTIPLD